MKKIMLSFLYIFVWLLTACSGVENPNQIFLEAIQGSWKIGSGSQNVFGSLTSPLDVPEGTPVSIGSDGMFTVAGVSFSFIEVEETGFVAIYRVVYGSDTQYLGLGFNIDDNILSTNPPFPSTIEQFKLSVQGPILLVK